MRLGAVLIVVVVGLGLVLLWGSVPRAELPNVIIFLVDDLGWMDTAVYGSRYYETRNIDRLAGAGMLFSDAYAASPHCSPTRASILTGRYPARLGIISAAGALAPLPPGASRYPAEASPRRKWVVPISRRFLALEEVTTAESLRQRGYRTAHIGKWHLGQLAKHWPDRQGFDVVFHGAPDPGPPSYFSPYGFRRGNITDGPEGEYITDRLTDEALAFIEDNRRRPFFLHLSHFGVHGPWGAKEEVRRRFPDREDPRGRQDNPVMAAMIQSVDESLGRIREKLVELGLSERTMVIFTSDNGGAMHTRTGPEGLLPTDNSPLRGAKGRLFEGGVRVPLIISWPSVVTPGSRSTEVVSSIDLHPTILEAAGVEPEPERVVDGVSLLPLLERTGGLARRAVFTHYALAGPPGVSVRHGRWKLIRWWQQTPWTPDPLELYDLEEDLGERRNLASRMPARAARLAALIDRFLTETGALLPLPNPSFDPRAAALSGWKEDSYLAFWPNVVRDPTGLELGNGVARLLLAHRRDQWSGLRLAFLRHPEEQRRVGPYLLELRARAERSLRGRLGLSYPESPGQMEQSQTFDLAGSSRWREVSLRFTVERAPLWIRLHFRTGVGDVEIDSIRIHHRKGRSGWPAFTPRLEWRFDLPG